MRTLGARGYHSWWKYFQNLTIGGETFSKLVTLRVLTIPRRVEEAVS